MPALHPALFAVNMKGVGRGESAAGKNKHAHIGGEYIFWEQFMEIPNALHAPLIAGDTYYCYCSLLCFISVIITVVIAVLVIRILGVILLLLDYFLRFFVIVVIFSFSFLLSFLYSYSYRISHFCCSSCFR